MLRLPVAVAAAFIAGFLTVAVQAAAPAVSDERTFIGTAGVDSFEGTPEADVVDLRGGHDTATGAGGRDVLQGRAGDDRLLGGAGADTLTGGAGRDRLKPSSGADHVFGGDGNDVITLAADGKADEIRCGAGNDLVGYLNGEEDPLDRLVSCETIAMIFPR